MGGMKSIRIGFTLCILATFICLVVKMCHTTMNGSSGAPTDSQGIQQLSRFEVAPATQILPAVRLTNESASSAGNGKLSLKTSAKGSTNFRKKAKSASKIIHKKLPPSKAQYSKMVRSHPQNGDSGKTGKRGLSITKKKISLPKAGTALYERLFLSNANLALNHFSRKNRTIYEKALRSVIDSARSRGLGWKNMETESLHDDQFLNYMKCPTSVRTRMLSNPDTQRRFVPETPILAWNEHYSHEEYQRLSEYLHVFGWKDPKESDVAAALSELLSTRNRYLFDDRLQLGLVPDDGRCIRCAVVGNGGILNGSRMGEEIDKNDYVFRVNRAITKGYEKDVGKRTSFYCFAMTTLSNSLAAGLLHNFEPVPKDEGVRYVFFADGYWAYTYLTSVLRTGKRVRAPHMFPIQFPRRITAADVKLVHPDFHRYLKFSWVNSTRKHRPVYRPTTGGIMLLLALHTCDEVNVYGFGGSYEKYTDHYYDKKFKKHFDVANHDTGAENKLWEMLHKNGIINLYQRDSE